ncbi:MAG: response regulator, partial [Desulfosarcinaceae bacterium]
MLQTDMPVMEGGKKANLSKDAAAAALKPFKVLSVDSDADVLAFVRSHLEKEGLAVTSAGSGAEAIRVLEFGRVDLVIIDINVSGVDGLSLLRYVRG